MRAFALALVALLAFGCGDDDAPSARWTRVFDRLDAALISVWGTSSSHVYTVGGDDGNGPLALHFDGAEWTRIAMGDLRADLWWVYGFEGGPTFFAGSKGTILRYEGGTVTPMTTPASTGIVYGIWGAAPDDLWAVGGSGSTGGGFVWRYDGSEWRALTLSGPAAQEQIFKVHGTSASDVWLVGSGGTLLHSTGGDPEAQPSPTTRTMFTISVLGDRIAMVGGFGDGELFEKDGEGEFMSLVPRSTPTLIGVVLTEDGGYASGQSGTIVRGTRDGWALETTGLESAEDLHSVWVDPDGGVWAVGGQVAAPPLVDGVMIHDGDDVPGGTFREE